MDYYGYDAPPSLSFKVAAGGAVYRCTLQCVAAAAAARRLGSGSQKSGSTSPRDGAAAARADFVRLRSCCVEAFFTRAWMEHGDIVQCEG